MLSNQEIPVHACKTIKYLIFNQNTCKLFYFFRLYNLKDGLSPCRKSFFTCFIDGPSKMMKNAFSFMLKALFVLKIFKYLS